MNLGQLIEYNKRNIVFQKLCRKWGRKTSSSHRFIFWKSLIWGESKRSAAKFRYISIALNLLYNKSQLYKILDYWSFFRKRPGTSFSTTFCVWFLKKNVSYPKFYLLNKFDCVIAVTSWDNGQYVYYNCLLTRLWYHKIWNWPYLFNQAVMMHDHKVKTKT